LVLLHRPNSIDDSLARADWGWKPRFDLRAMTHDMLVSLQERMKREQERAARNGAARAAAASMAAGFPAPGRLG
jgi:hypothetical protein